MTRKHPRVVRLVSLILAITLTLSMLPLYAIEASAASVSTMSELVTRLNNLIAEYHDTYWTTDGNAGNSEGTTSKYYAGIQCSGFAKYIFNELFCTGSIGQTKDNKYEMKNLNEAYLVSQGIISKDAVAAQNVMSKGYPGDFVQMKRNAGGPHSLIIVEVTPRWCMVL